MDFKGPWEVAEGHCYPLSILDDYSRYLVDLGALKGTGAEGVAAQLVRTFESHGVPEAMLMDHGTPWWSTTNGHGLTWLSVELIKQGIRLHFSGIRHPQTQGKVETFSPQLETPDQPLGKPATLADSAQALAAFRKSITRCDP